MKATNREGTDQQTASDPDAESFEVSRIMNEIEELQSQMGILAPEPRLGVASAGASLVPEEPAETLENNDFFKGIECGTESLLDETLAGLAAIPPSFAKVAPKQSLEAVPERKVAPQVNIPQKEIPLENALSMTVTGQMSLKLNFECAGQNILVHFNAELIHIQFSDGTEFKVPIKTVRRSQAQSGQQNAA